MGFQIKTTYSNKDGQLSTAFPFFIKSWGIIALPPFLELFDAFCSLETAYLTSTLTKKMSGLIKWFYAIPYIITNFSFPFSPIYKVPKYTSKQQKALLIQSSR
jgi:hypothetical protein